MDIKSTKREIQSYYPEAKITKPSKYTVRVTIGDLKQSAVVWLTSEDYRHRFGVRGEGAARRVCTNAGSFTLAMAKAIDIAKGKMIKKPNYIFYGSAHV